MRVFRNLLGRDWSSWPVMLLLLTMLIPSAGVVWMMRAAVENERLAVRQRLADAYQVQLESVKRAVDEHWSQQLTRLADAVGERAGAEAFASGVASGVVDSVIILGENGAVAYPASTAPGAVEPLGMLPAWQEAERLEFAAGDYRAAAGAYAKIASDENLELSTAAQQAQARALVKAGDRAAAIEVLRELSGRDRAIDAQGRSLAADAELRLLELLGPASVEWAQIALQLTGRLNDYARAMPASQRRFLMRRVVELAPEAANFPTLKAEELAAEFVAVEFDKGSDWSLKRPVQRDEGLRPTVMKDVWVATTSGGRAAALYRTRRIEADLAAVLGKQLAPAGVKLDALPAARAAEADDALLSASLAPALPGWRLTMSATGGKFFDEAASRRRALLGWIAALLVGVTLALTALVAGGLRRQMQVARLKNDLVATVSHELKTPLASTRLLVDSLLDEDGVAASQVKLDDTTREYLELISQENARLSRLIDNFLTFSRMERGKNRFEFALLEVRRVIDGAMLSVGERFDGPDAKLEVECESSLWLRGDCEALVAAVINLLDNAWKYTGADKRVTLSATKRGEHVEIAVQDNGPGLSAWAARRVFDRFYQVDQRLSRTHGGCGLGLSIVRYIVEAHGGRAEVQSRPGEGCRFTLTLPAISKEEVGSVESHEGSDWSLKRPVPSGEGQP